MQHATSKDGTTIAFDQIGTGSPIILVGGGPTDRSANASLAALLAPHVSVINYDRRGRGASGDTAPYAVEREVEDLDALITVAGGSACVYGSSSGAVFALEAAARGLGPKITKLALWEPPYIVDDSRPRIPQDYKAQLSTLIASGRRGDAIAYFMTTIVGLPAEFVALMRHAPFWTAMENLAHTIVYEADIMGDYALPTERLGSVTVPTLVIDGGETPWMSAGAQAVAAALPDARRRTLTGQPHNVAPEAIAPVLREFFVG